MDILPFGREKLIRSELTLPCEMLTLQILKKRATDAIQRLFSLARRLAPKSRRTLPHSLPPIVSSPKAPTVWKEDRAMRMMNKLFAGAAGFAAIATAAPAAAQYYPYGYGNYQYNGYNRYANSYGAYGMNNAAAQQCTAAVQSRLANRTSL